MVFFVHNNYKEWQSERYDTWQATSQGDNIRYNASDVFNNSNSLSLSNLWRFDDLFGKVGLVVSDGVQFDDKSIMIICIIRTRCFWLRNLTC